MNIEIKRLIVKYHGLIVGFLEELQNKTIAFQYDLNWLKNGFSISPLSLPLEDKVFISSSTYFGGLYGVFFDSLPDGWGELLVRRMLLKKGINFDKLSILSRLSLLSANALGGLTYEPSQSDKTEYSHNDFDQLYVEMNKLFDNPEEVDDFDIIYLLGGSSGGARPKAHIKIDQEEWIIKFPSSLDPRDIGMLEYKANTTAKKCGINVNDFILLPSNKTSGYFASKRFDRKDGKRVHMISLAAILETSHLVPTLDYVHLFQVIQVITSNQEDLYEAYRRMCFNVLYGNKDDHSKNFAFLYNETQRRYQLSPAYDLTNTPIKLEHEMTVLGEEKPTKKNLIEIAKEIGLSMKKCSEIIKNIESMIIDTSCLS